LLWPQARTAKAAAETAARAHETALADAKDRRAKEVAEAGAALDAATRKAQEAERALQAAVAEKYAAADLAQMHGWVSRRP
jgi:hypothetical protein